MAYYDAMVAGWNSATQPPSGVTGTPITGSMTTQQKLDAMNRWTTTGTAIRMIIPTYEIYTVMDVAEFNALTAANQQNMRDILAMGNVDLSPNKPARNRMLQLFGAGTVTRAAMSAMAVSYDTPTVNWCGKNGYPLAQNGGIGGLTQIDAAAAGLV
jgi:hypothetical protein